MRSSGGRAGTIVLYAIAGAVVGGVFVAPLLGGPGDPFGHLTGGAAGCVAGIIAALFTRSS